MRQKRKKMRSIGFLSSEDGSKKAPGRREGVEGLSAKGTWVPEMRKAQLPCELSCEEQELTC